MSQQHDNPEEDSAFQELEEKLARLAPAPPSVAFTRRTGRRLDELERNRHENRVVWVRFAPVAAAACIVLTATFLLRNQLIEQQLAETTERDESGFEIVSDPARGPAPVFNDNVVPVSGGFRPVSEDRQLRRIEPGDIIGSRPDGLPERELYLQFDKTQLYYNPDTQTRVEVQTPEEGILRIPVPVD